MPYHHLAIATRDMKATHEFYTDAMGFELVRAEKVVEKKVKIFSWLFGSGWVHSAVCYVRISPV